MTKGGRDVLVRVACLVGALALAVCTRARPTGQPIDTMNPVIGDVSFVEAFGRSPTAHDDLVLRVRTHLAYVEARLRQRDVSALSPVRRASRAALLELLHRYWRAGAFPAGESAVGYLPTFVDSRGVRCAVAYLVEQTAGPDVVARLDRDFHNAFVAQIDAPEFEAWAAASGFTKEELVLVQPSYPPTQPNLAMGLAADSRHAAAGDPALQIASLQSTFRSKHHLSSWLPALILGADAGIGAAGTHGLAYNAHARFGIPELLTGIGVDRAGDLVPASWTIPLDASYRFRLAWNTRFGLAGGPRFRFAGADRSLGWSAWVELLRLDTFVNVSSDEELSQRSLLLPSDLFFRLTAEGLAGSTLFGITIGIATRPYRGLGTD
ncbi:MAG TPA: hypothetical protein VNO21_19115 [Polyangiaceae bacterium]|nr:hypothetical protein [Polyangiaceae bacterium]